MENPEKWEIEKFPKFLGINTRYARGVAARVYLDLGHRTQIRGFLSQPATEPIGQPLGRGGRALGWLACVGGLDAQACWLGTP